jgi:hypothetical protein
MPSARLHTPDGGEHPNTRSDLRINRLIDDILRDPFEGVGKPEPLRHALPAVGHDGSARNNGSSTWSTATTS